MKPPKNFYNNLDRMKQDINGGADVPTPSAEDAGKAIVVSDEGKYELGSVGSEAFIINITEKGTDTRPGKVDKTDAEIYEAILAGKDIYLNDTMYEGSDRESVLIKMSSYFYNSDVPGAFGQFKFISPHPTNAKSGAGNKGYSYMYSISYTELAVAKSFAMEWPTGTTSKNGMCLTYNSSNKSYELKLLVPVPTTADAGKSLKVGSDGKYYLDFNSGLEVAEKNYFQLQGDSSALLLDGVVIAAGDKIDVSYHTNGVPYGQCSVINTSDASWDARRNLSIHYADREWYISNYRVGDWSEGDVNILYDLAVNTAYQVTASGRTALVTNIDSAIFVGKTVRFGPLQGLGGKNYGAYIKSVKIYDSSNVLKHDLVPVAVGESSSFLMDKVTNKLYANSGLSRAIDTI